MAFIIQGHENCQPKLGNRYILLLDIYFLLIFFLTILCYPESCADLQAVVTHSSEMKEQQGVTARNVLDFNQSTYWSPPTDQSDAFFQIGMLIR